MSNTKQQKYMPMTPNESHDYYVRRRILHWKQQGCTQKATLKALHDHDGIENTGLSTVKRNWHKSTDKLARRASTGPKPKVTPKLKKKLRKYSGSNTKSVRKIQRELKSKGKDIHYSTISRTYTKILKLPALIRPTCSKFNEEHARWRLIFAQKHVNLPISYWMNILFTDEKYVENNGINNKQNNRVRAKSVADIDPSLYIQKEKFSEKQMCWGGISGYGLSKCVWLPPKENVDADSYYWKCLRGEVVKIKKRTATTGPMYKRKLWDEDHNHP